MDSSVVHQVEMGQGLHTKMIQVAAETLGVPAQLIHVAETATDKVANSQPTAASASTDLYCMATLDACARSSTGWRLCAKSRPTPRSPSWARSSRGGA